MTTPQPLPPSTSRLPKGWAVVAQDSEDAEFVHLRLPPEVTRISAALRLSIHAEFGGWKLSRVRLYSDGTRRVLLERRKTTHHVPDPGI
ncbi:DUF5703 family protein [Rhodococcus sp. NPDC058521]|uniref:DUF5703 family protein n=1 Tax=Rhodococcus sp. NPDC058521 TaxID=3346536 RepID=UPI0036626EDC